MKIDSIIIGDNYILLDGDLSTNSTGRDLKRGFIISFGMKITSFVLCSLDMEFLKKK